MHRGRRRDASGSWGWGGGGGVGEDGEDRLKEYMHIAREKETKAPEGRERAREGGSIVINIYFLASFLPTPLVVAVRLCAIVSRV